MKLTTISEKQRNFFLNFTHRVHLHKIMTKQSEANGRPVASLFQDKHNLRRLFLSDHTNPDDTLFDTHSHRYSNASTGAESSSSAENSPKSSNASFHDMSPWMRPPATLHAGVDRNGLIGSIVQEDGHVYSLSSSGGLLYTGSDKKHIRVWNDLNDYSVFKSSSGLVKAIVISGDKIFTGHQDGKIRVWKFSPGNNPKPYKRVGSLPTTKDYVKISLSPKSYVQVQWRRNVPWIKHCDAVSSLSLDEEQGILYSGSWDRTLKVWRISDQKCLESINAHDDAINAVVYGSDGLVFTGSADGTVKVWRREFLGRITKHVLVEVLLKQENAVTSLAVNAATLYCGSSDGLVNFWEMGKKFNHGGVLRGHKLAVLCLEAAGNLVFSGSTDKSICVWRRGVGGDHTCSSVLAAHFGPVKCLAVEEDEESPKGDRRWILYSGSLDKFVKIWRVSER